MNEQVRFLFFGVAVSVVFLVVPTTGFSQESTDIRIITGFNGWIFSSGKGNGRYVKDGGFSIGGGISKPIAMFLRLEYNGLYFQEAYCLLGYGERAVDGGIRGSRFWNHVWQNQFAMRFFNILKLGLTYDITFYRSSERGVYIENIQSVCLYTGPGDQFIYHTLNFNIGFGCQIKKRIGIEFDYIVGLTPWYIQGKPVENYFEYDNQLGVVIEGRKVCRQMFSISLIYFIHLGNREKKN